MSTHLVSSNACTQVERKAWQLSGEVNAKQRPVNSLLETSVDFQQATKAAPQITEEVFSIDVGRLAVSWVARQLLDRASEWP